MYRFIWTVSLGLIALINTGCMLEPLNHSSTHYRRATFSGYTTAPNQGVSIQARNPDTGRWEQITRTESVDFATHHRGDRWYYWSARYLYIRNAYWRPLEDQPGRYKCEVRAVSEDGMQLLTYDQEPFVFGDTTDQWMEHGNRRGTVTLYSNHPDF